MLTRIDHFRARNGNGLQLRLSVNPQHKPLLHQTFLGYSRTSSPTSFPTLHTSAHPPRARFPLSFIPPAAATVVQSTRFRCSGVQASSSHSVASWFPFDAMPGVDRGHTWLTSHMRLYTKAFRSRQVDYCFPLAALAYLILRPLIQLLLARHSTRACPRAFSSSWEVLI